MRVTLACMGFENQGVEALSAFLKAHGHEVALAFDPALFDDKLLFHEHRLKSLFDDPEPFAVADVPDPHKVPIEVSGVSAVIGSARGAFSEWVEANHPSLHDDLWG